MQPDDFNLNDVVAVLRRTPASLSALLDGLPGTWVTAAEGEGEWSPNEVIVHLIRGEYANWMPRAMHILSGHQEPFQAFDRTLIPNDMQAKLMSELLATFAEVRRENVATLEGLHLTSADLSRTGLHPELGEVRLQQLLATWVVHDLNHIAQIVRTMAQVYGAAVGPWRAYLAILDEGAEPE